MKKVIISLDGQHFPKGAFEFVKSINSKNQILLAGVCHHLITNGL